MKKLLLPLALVGAWLTAGIAQAEDWVHWRGPEQNGVSRDKDLPDRFSLNASDPNSNLIWKQPYGGRSAPIILNGRVYLINDAGSGINEQERVMCFDAATGKVLWEYRFNIFFTDIVSSRVGWTNLAADPETGNIYAHGVQGLFFCFDRGGKVLWSHSMTEEYGRISGYGGRVNSPIIDGDLVILGLVNASWGDQARPGNRFVAMDKRTGVPVWWSDAGPFKGTYYSTPIIAIINGERLLLSGGSDGFIHALRVRTGEQIWTYEVGARSINSSPVVDGTRVYISHGEENVDTNVKGRVVCLEAGQIKDKKPKLLWKVDNIRGGYTAPIIHEGRLYVCDDRAKMFCLDAATGKTLWRFNYGTAAKGSPVLADGKIYICEVSSKFHILQPGERECKELFTQFFRSSDGSVIELNGSPSIADGRIYFTTADEILCIGKKDAPAGPSPPGLPKEADANANAKIASIQVVPADVAIHPGESASFEAQAFDAQGRFLKKVTAQWSLPAPPIPQGAKEGPPPLKGQINAEGKLLVAPEPSSQQGMVLAKVGNFAGRARVCVVPRIPYAQNFEKIPAGRTPGGWINVAGKFMVEEKDGSKVLRKTADNPNPLICRANVFFGAPTSTDYTVQADLLGTKSHSDMPDMGVIANRYTLMLDGNKQRLRIASWESLPRVDSTVGFNWSPSTWYRLKFTVEVRPDGKAVARGKAWPRDKEEPADWSLQFEDPTPNREGSPGIYAYSTGILPERPGSEIFYDNIHVTPNKTTPHTGQ